MIELRDICPEGHEIELRQTELRKEEDNPSSEILGWLMFGVCDKCKKIFVQGIHQEKIEPTEGIDYIIVHKKCDVAKKSKDSHLKILKELDIVKIKEKLGEKELIDDDEKEKIDELRKDFQVNSISFAKLFLKCYHFFDSNSDLLKEFKIGLNFYDKDIEDLRKELENYGSGADFGSSYVLERIRMIMDKNREEKVELINLLFKILREED